MPGWAVGPSPNRELALVCWEQARTQLEAVGRGTKDLIIHQDQDAVYTSYRWLRALLIESEAIVSYPERGAKDNPWIESFWGHFKGENASLLIEAETLVELRGVIDRQMIYYNERRRHSSLTYRPPVEYLKSEGIHVAPLAQTDLSTGSTAGAQVPLGEGGGHTMKVVILAGGYGSRLQEETATKPKPMVEIGGRPILWHIMNIYAAYGYKEFIIALGYKAEVIKNYFLNYYYLNSGLTVSLDDGNVRVLDGERKDWVVHLVDTGLHTEKGGRLKRLGPWLSNETFMMTYGDGVSDVNIRELVAFHKRHGKLATVTTVRPPARFGSLSLEGELAVRFREKSQIGEGWINGGFFVLEPGVLDYIEGDNSAFEKEPMERLARDGQLAAYRHDGFWQCMDTLRDVIMLEDLWQNDQAPWK